MSHVSAGATSDISVRSTAGPTERSATAARESPSPTICRKMESARDGSTHQDSVANLLVTEPGHVLAVRVVAWGRLEHTGSWTVALACVAVGGDAVGVVDLSSSFEHRRRDVRRRRRRRGLRVSVGFRRLHVRRARNRDDERTHRSEQSEPSFPHVNASSSTGVRTSRVRRRPEPRSRRRAGRATVLQLQLARTAP